MIPVTFSRRYYDIQLKRILFCEHKHFLSLWSWLCVLRMRKQTDEIHIDIFSIYWSYKSPHRKTNTYILHNTHGNAFNIFVIKWHPLSLCSCISRRPLPALLSNLIISFNSDLVLKVLARTEKNRWKIVEQWEKDRKIEVLTKTFSRRWILYMV